MIEYKIIGFSNNIVSFQIVKQKYRMEKFYPKNKFHKNRFYSKKGFILISAYCPQFKLSEVDRCYVLGECAEKDEYILSMSLKHFSKFYDAVKEYNKEMIQNERSV